MAGSSSSYLTHPGEVAFAIDANAISTEVGGIGTFTVGSGVGVLVGPIAPGSVTTAETPGLSTTTTSTRVAKVGVGVGVFVVVAVGVGDGELVGVAMKVGLTVIVGEGSGGLLVVGSGKNSVDAAAWNLKPTAITTPTVPRTIKSIKAKMRRFIHYYSLSPLK
jgi:hypothetical protein